MMNNHQLTEVMINTNNDDEEEEEEEEEEFIDFTQ